MPRVTSYRQHDVAYRDLFTHPELVEDLLTHFVGEAWVKDLRFETLRRESEISVAREVGTKVKDVVWSVEFADRQLYILILVEFQSRPDPIMALREIIYVCSLYEDLYKQKRFTADRKLPPVLPIVLYKGRRPWRAPTSVEDMVAAVPPELEKFIPRMTYFLLDELRTNVTISENERNTVAAVLKLEQSEVGAEIIDIACILLKWLREPEQESLRQAFRELVRKSLPVVYGPIAEIFEQPEDAMTLAQRLKKSYDLERSTARAEGRQEGRLEGRQEGLQEGLEKGQRSLLAKQLRLKFGALDVETERRLAEADLTQLQLWAERILTAKTLAQVWAD